MWMVFWYVMPIACAVLAVVFRRKLWVRWVCVSMVLFLALNLVWFGVRVAARHVETPPPVELLPADDNCGLAWSKGRMGTQEAVDVFLDRLVLCLVVLGVIGAIPVNRKAS